MNVLQTSKRSHKYDSITPDQEERQPRVLTPEERRVKSWIKQHRGVLSELARQFNVSVQFVQRIAYNREAKSRGMRIERRLHAMGCPLIQRIR